MQLLGGEGPLAGRPGEVERDVDLLIDQGKRGPANHEVIAGAQAESLALAAAEKHRITGRVEGLDLQFAVLVDDFHMLTRNAVVPGSGPGPRLPADRVVHARLQFATPAMLWLCPLGDEVGHEESRESKNRRTE